MKETSVKRLIACNIPISACNLKCHYCYISQLKEWTCVEKRKLNPELVERAFSVQRLGGVCIINLTGKGETLLPREVPDIIFRLLNQGHYLEVVTNGTLTERFDQISKFPRELLSHLEFKFSFHYLELKKRNLIDEFFNNVNKMRNAGCSFTVELMPNDDIVTSIKEIIEICNERVGAPCHLTIGRDDTDNRKILTQMDIQDYLNTWNKFDSKMFQFKYSVFGIKRQEFCYAGMWSLYVNLLTGDARPCYGFKADQNIYEDVNKPICFRPVGCRCKQEFCYNAHAFMTLGVIPEIDTPTYAEIRDRIDKDGNHWLTPEVYNAFSSKLENSNEKLSNAGKVKFYLGYPFYWFRILTTNRKKVLPAIKRRFK